MQNLRVAKNATCRNSPSMPTRTTHGAPSYVESTLALMKHTEWLRASWDGSGLVLVLTGAGISAESGVPTFRGQEGYWRIGSQHYFPEKLATREAFEDMP